MKYKISTCGAGIAVALLDPNTAEEDINLSHNLHNTHAGNTFYNGSLSFNSSRQFYRFLINKYYLRYWTPNKTFRQILKKATNKARYIINNEVEYDNFMPRIYQRNLYESNKRIYKWHHPKYTNDNTEN